MPGEDLVMSNLLEWIRTVTSAGGFAIGLYLVGVLT